MSSTGPRAPRGAADRLAYLLKLIAAGPPQFTLGELAASAGLPTSSASYNTPEATFSPPTTYKPSLRRAGTTVTVTHVLN